MCVFPINANPEYDRDILRGRHKDVGRFYRLDDYAYARWTKARDLRHARQWWLVMEAVKRRSPGWLGARYSIDRMAAPSFASRSNV